MQLFTTAETAAYLRLKERKIYEMVTEGTVPCTKVTGRWLFPKAELDHWLVSSISRPAGLTPAEPAPIVGGSHDPLLEWALRESGSGLATLAVGSEAGFARFVAAETIAASMHLHALEDPDADALEHVRRTDQCQWRGEREEQRRETRDGEQDRRDEHRPLQPDDDDHRAAKRHAHSEAGADQPPGRGAA